MYPDKHAQMQKTLYDYLREHAQESGEKSYLITENGVITYAAALATVNNFRAELMRRGVKKGELVAVRATRSTDTIIIVLALCSIGAVSVLTDPHFAVREYIFNSGVAILPEWYITNERAGGGVSAYGDWTLETQAETVTSIEFSAAAIDTYVDKTITPNDPFMIIFTSGSTGKSKAVMLSHKNCVANPVDAMPLFREDENDRAIALLPLNHAFGFAVTACATFCGHDVVFPARTETEYILGCIQKYKISCIYAVPTFFLELLSGDRHKHYDISSLRLGLMAGGPFTDKQMRFIEGELGMELMPGYGMSECIGISTMRYGDPVEERAAGVGRLYPMTRAFILDDNGDELPRGEVGEICVIGETQMLGYYNNPEETLAVTDAQGRLHTGDLGYMDERDILHVSGRKKDIIIRGGENISAGKIERALLDIPGVYQAAVVAVKDEKYGEVPAAAVILKAGCALTSEQIKTALEGALSRHEIPSCIDIVKQFPLNASGKIDKLKLKEMLNS